jgi:hypothetical protein
MWWGVGQPLPGRSGGLLEPTLERGALVMMKQFLFALTLAVVGVTTTLVGFAWHWPFVFEGAGFLAVSSYLTSKATDPEFSVFAVTGW